MRPDHFGTRRRVPATGMTLDDLARELDVSISTVSRALTRPEIVAPATLERVLAAVKAHRFQPNGIARSLRTRTTPTIGIVVPDISNWFFGLLVKAVGEVAKAAGYAVLICDSDEAPGGEEHALEVLRGRQAGIINCPAGADGKLWRAAVRSGTPLVELDRQSGLAGVDSVTLDDFGAAAMAVDHLVGLGHRHIATVAGPEHLSNGRLRLEGLRDALTRHGLDLPAAYVRRGDFREDSGYHSVKELLAHRPAPTAIFVANSEMTGGAVAALRELGVRVPRDVSLVGFDDARWARYVEPPLTTIRHPTEEMGRCAGELLLARIRQADAPRRPQRIVFSPELVIRNSTAPPAKPPKLLFSR